MTENALNPREVDPLETVEMLWNLSIANYFLLVKYSGVENGITLYRFF